MLIFSFFYILEQAKHIKNKFFLWKEFLSAIFHYIILYTLYFIHQYSILVIDISIGIVIDPTPLIIKLES